MAPRAVDRLRLLHVLASRPLQASANAHAQRLFAEPWLLETLEPAALRRLAQRPCGFCSGAESVS